MFIDDPKALYDKGKYFTSRNNLARYVGIGKNMTLKEAKADWERDRKSKNKLPNPKMNKKIKLRKEDNYNYGEENGKSKN